MTGASSASATRWIGTSFERVGAAVEWLLVKAGANHSLGVATDGILMGWGYNTAGQLGLGDTTDRLVPTSTGFKVDVTGPVTAALKQVTVKKGALARLRYRVNDEFCAQVTGVKIKLKRSGKTVKTFALGTKDIGKQYVKSFRARLATGTYRWSVFATDTAGNVQRTVGASKLKVL